MVTESKEVFQNSISYQLMVEPRRKGIKLPLFTRGVGFTILGVSIFLALFHLFMSRATPIDIYGQRYIALSLFMVLCILTHPLRRSSWKEKANWGFIIDAAICIFLVVTVVFVVRDPIYY